MIADYEGDITDLFDISTLDEIPILATRNLMMFPGVIMPVLVGRPASLALLDEVSKKDGALFAVFCQKDSNVENPNEEDLCEYGVYARLVRVIEMPGAQNNKTAIIQGLGRCVLADITKKTPFLMGTTLARTEIFPGKDDKEYETALSDMYTSVSEYIKKNEDIPNEAQFALNNISNNIIAVNFICSNMPFNIDDKVELLSKDYATDRLFALLRVLNRETQILDL